MKDFRAWDFAGDPFNWKHFKFFIIKKKRVGLGRWVYFAARYLLGIKHPLDDIRS